MIERAADVEKSHVESVQEGQALLENKHGWQARPPLGLRQQPHRPLHPHPQPGLQAPQPRCRLPPTDTAAALLPTLQLVLQAHQDLVQEVRKEGMAEDEEASSGPWGDFMFSGIHLDDADIFFTQGLVTWEEKSGIKRQQLQHTFSKVSFHAGLVTNYLRMLLIHSMQGLTAALSLSSSPATFWILQKERKKTSTDIHIETDCWIFYTAISYLNKQFLHHFDI